VPSEDELRAAYEAELARMQVSDVLAQAVVSLMNMAALRLRDAPAGGEGAAGAGSPEGEAGELDQARDAIDGARALLAILERTVPEQLKPLRDGLSQLQLAYASRVRTAPAKEAPPGGGGPGGGPQPAPQGERPAGQEGHRPGPAESSGRLWVPGR
jgi:hypothetical protein